MSVFAARRERLLAQIRAEGLDVLLVTQPLNVTYLTGFTGEATYLVLAADRLLLLSDGRFVEQLTEECPGLEAVIRPPGQTLADATGKTLTQLGGRAVGFESGHLTVADFESIREHAKTLDWKAGAGRVETLRMVKDDGELAQVREAVTIAENAFAKFRAELRPEQTEKELHDAMEFHVRRCGGRQTAFPTIVAVGPRAALPHAPPTSRTLGESPFFLLDWGASGPLYKSDLTRVLWTRALTTASDRALHDRLMHIYRILEDARAAALAKMRPGVAAEAVDAAARDVIAQAGFGEQFNHGLGHGFGLQIHEAPFLRPGNKTVLAAGMVVTLEPGIYLPGELGVRIEDDILITPDDPVMLTSVPQSPDAIAVNL